MEKPAIQDPLFKMDPNATMLYENGIGSKIIKAERFAALCTRRWLLARHRERRGSGLLPQNNGEGHSVGELAKGMEI